MKYILPGVLGSAAAVYGAVTAALEAGICRGFIEKRFDHLINKANAVKFRIDKQYADN